MLSCRSAQGVEQCCTGLACAKLVLHVETSSLRMPFDIESASRSRHPRHEHRPVLRCRVFLLLWPEMEDARVPEVYFGHLRLFSALVLVL